MRAQDTPTKPPEWGSQEVEHRRRGCLLGLAVGDALGTPLEFKAPGTFAPVSDLIGGGPFSLKAGQWTGDTSMALWAFYHAGDFREARLMAVNPGDDADTTGAVCGMIADAYYGEKGIPEDWLKKLAKRELITGYAERLGGGARGDPPGALFTAQPQSP